MTMAGCGRSHPILRRSPTAGRSGQSRRARLSVTTTEAAASVRSLAANKRPATRSMPSVSKYVASTALLVTRMGESKDSEAHSEPGGISGNDDVRAAVRTPGRPRNRSRAFAYTS